ncbi:MAG: ATP synthase F0 subunit B [Candidatus Binataceae bacterium]|nr:ATP synthase F0 subunit B [Candidatus Binataceae bacterium]
MHIPPDWGTFGILIVSFLGFWFIFNRIFLQPVLALLDRRESRLRELGERAAKLIQEREAAEARRAAELATIRRDALERREIERRRAEAEAQKIMEEARGAANAVIDRARTEVQNQLTAAEAELEKLGRRLAIELAERVMGRRLDGAAGSAIS